MKKISLLFLVGFVVIFFTIPVQAAKMAYLGNYTAGDIEVVTQVDKFLGTIGRTLKEGEPTKICLVENRIFDIHYSEIKYADFDEKCPDIGWLYKIIDVAGADKEEYLIALSSGEKKYDFYLFETEPKAPVEETVPMESKEPMKTEAPTTVQEQTSATPAIKIETELVVIDQPPVSEVQSGERIVPLPRDMRAGEKAYKTLSFLKTISPMEQMIVFAESIGLPVERSVPYDVCIDNVGSIKTVGTDRKFLFDVRSCMDGEKGKTPGVFGKYYTDNGRFAGATMFYPGTKNPQNFYLYGVVYIPTIKTSAKTVEQSAPQTAGPKELPKEEATVAIAPAEAEPAKVEKPKSEESVPTEENSPEDPMTKANKKVCHDDLWASIDPDLMRETDEYILGFTQDWAMVPVVLEAKGYRPLAILLPGKSLNYQPSCVFSPEQVAKAQARLATSKADLDKVEVGVCYEHLLTIIDSANSATREEKITDCGRIDSVVYSNGRALLAVKIGRRDYADNVGICEVKKFKSRVSGAQETFEKLQQLECAKSKTGASS